MANDINYSADLMFDNGDFVVSESTEQHIEDILLAKVGDYKQHPLIGVGIEDWQHAPFTGLVRQNLQREIKLQLDSDGAKNTSVIIEDFENIQIRANYE